MIRILVEVSLPARTLEGLAAAAASLFPLRTTVERVPAEFERGGHPEGGPAGWVSCWISAEADDRPAGELAGPLRGLKELICQAAREGGLELLKIPANVQIDDGYYRLRDLLDVVSRLT